MLNIKTRGSKFKVNTIQSRVQTKILRGITPILLRGRLNLRTSEVQQVIRLYRKFKYNKSIAILRKMKQQDIQLMQIKILQGIPPIL